MASRDSLPSTSPSPEIKKIPVGGGRITLAVHGKKAVFEELSSAYPLKLLSPQVHEQGVAIVYVLSYGGGLIAGDRVELDVKLKEGSKLLVLSQVGSYACIDCKTGLVENWIMIYCRDRRRCSRLDLDNDLHRFDQAGQIPAFHQRPQMIH